MSWCSLPKPANWLRHRTSSGSTDQNSLTSSSSCILFMSFWLAYVVPSLHLWMGLCNFYLKHLFVFFALWTYTQNVRTLLIMTLHGPYLQRAGRGLCMNELALDSRTGHALSASDLFHHTLWPMAPSCWSIKIKHKQALVSFVLVMYL